MNSRRALLPRHREESRSSFPSRAQLLLILSLLATGSWAFYLLQKGDHLPRTSSKGAGSGSPGAGGTLIIYVFRNLDPESVNNLIHFITHGIRAGDGARYLVAMDPTLPEAETPPLPELPPNAEFVHPPACFENGVVGWLLYTSEMVTISDYRQFVWVSSSTKGPFLPAYVSAPWHTLLTQKLRGRVRLVGPTISCTPLIIDMAQPPIHHPHVQASVMATDRIGLGLMKNVGALDCHNNWLDNVRFGEFGASGAVLKAGFNLDSLMLRYQGADWRDDSHWNCNAKLDPQLEGAYDGTSLNPLEVMFLPTSFAQLVVETPAVGQGVQYSEWADATLKSPSRRDLGGNAWLGKATRLSKDVMSRPAACFDSEFYVMASPVEFRDFEEGDAYRHFKDTGFREGRPYMFLC